MGGAIAEEGKDVRAAMFLKGNVGVSCFTEWAGIYLKLGEAGVPEVCFLESFFLSKSRKLLRTSRSLFPRLFLFFFSKL